tara:strand:+ start:186 stop:365 length:180 start_codon:yes stop_codon:yes gene_type:complete
MHRLCRSQLHKYRCFLLTISIGTLKEWDGVSQSQGLIDDLALFIQLIPREALADVNQIL